MKEDIELCMQSGDGEILARSTYLQYESFVSFVDLGKAYDKVSPKQNDHTSFIGYKRSTLGLSRVYISTTKQVP